MNLPRPLQPEALYNALDPAEFPFETTAELEDGLEIIGQQRAIDAIRFGIGIRHQGTTFSRWGQMGLGGKRLPIAFSGRVPRTSLSLMIGATSITLSILTSLVPTACRLVALIFSAMI